MNMAVVQKPIRMGTTLSDPENDNQLRFIPFDHTKSLKEIGIKDGSSIYLRLIETTTPVAASPSTPNNTKEEQK